jgi:hypothetical protein
VRELTQGKEAAAQRAASLQHQLDRLQAVQQGLQASLADKEAAQEALTVQLSQVGAPRGGGRAEGGARARGRRHLGPHC